jgi:hypothetical protein
VRIFGTVVEMTPSFLATFAPNHLHGCSIRRASIRDDDMRITVSLDCFLEEFQCSGFVPFLSDVGFKDFAFTVDSAPEIMALAPYVGYACLRLTKTSSRCHCHYGLRRFDSERRFLIL